MIDRGDDEVHGGVGEVAAGPGETGGLFGEAGGVAERAGEHGDVLAGGADGLLGPPVRGIAARVGLGRAAAQLLGAGQIHATRFEQGADRGGERVAGVICRAGQLQGRFAVQ